MEVPLNAIRETFGVREMLDQSEVERLMMLIADGQVAPVLVAQIDDGGVVTYEVIDGRTRLEAYRRWEYKEVPVTLYKGKTDYKSKFLAAIKANENDGPRALNKRDIQRDVLQLKKAGASDAEICAAFPDCPKHVRESLMYAKSNIKQAKVNRAVGLVRDEGYTVRKASLEVGVTEDDIKSRMQNKKKGEENKAGHFDKLLKSANLKYGQSISQINRHVNDAVDSQEIGVKAAKNLLDRQKAYAQDLLRQVDERMRRFLNTHHAGVA